jgi:hypothetical protein
LPDKLHIFDQRDGSRLGTDPTDKAGR